MKVCIHNTTYLSKEELVALIKALFSIIYSKKCFFHNGLSKVGHLILLILHEQHILFTVLLVIGGYKKNWQIFCKTYFGKNIYFCTQNKEKVKITYLRILCRSQKIHIVLISEDWSKDRIILTTYSIFIWFH